MPVLGSSSLDLEKYWSSLKSLMTEKWGKGRKLMARKGGSTVHQLYALGDASMIVLCVRMRMRPTATTFLPLCGIFVATM
jgi:hypothetical protein